jgi:hypothetical protein
VQWFFGKITAHFCNAASFRYNSSRLLIDLRYNDTEFLILWSVLISRSHYGIMAKGFTILYDFNSVFKSLVDPKNKIPSIGFLEVMQNINVRFSNFSRIKEIGLEI